MSRYLRPTRLEVRPFESRIAPATDVLTFHGDLGSTGVINTETELAPANLGTDQFGKLYTTGLDGQTYAEPLVKTGVTIADGPNTTAGAAGVHDVVFVATQHDSLYAIDTTDGTVLWQRTFLDITVPANNTLGASAITSVPNGDTGTADISPEVGITSTPVIDPATGILYLVAKTKETIGGTGHYIQRLHAINIADGTDRAAPFLIGDTVATNTNNTPIYVYGNGDGSVTDPYNGTGLQVVQFNALREHQRSALTLVNGKVYVAWASHGDNGPYHGWVVTFDVSHLTTTGINLAGVFNACPNNAESGIWQGGGKLVFEPDGSAFYFETGNGTGGAPTLNGFGFPNNANYNEAVVKVVADATTSPTNQNANGWGLKVVDYFMPYNVAALDGADSDFGSGAPVLLPDSAGIPGHPHLMIAGGKEGKLYVLDRDNLGHFDAANDHALNSVPDGSGHNTPPRPVSGGLFGTPAWFNGQLYATGSIGGPAYAFTLGQDGHLTAASQTSIGTFGYLAGQPLISADGTNNGIVWVSDRQRNQIHAYDATTLATELWNTEERAGGLDSVGAVVKFAEPTVADGRVFVGTAAGLVVYGHFLPPTDVPQAPTLSATALSGTAINLTWTDPTPPQDRPTGYAIEESLDGNTFNPVTTAPAGATSLAIGGLQPSTHYYFRMHGVNALGASPPSNVADATTLSSSPPIDYSAGFTANGMTFNGSAHLAGTALRLTDDFNQTASAFFNTPVDVTGFSTWFTFQLVNAQADGFTITIQGNGPTALGAFGGDLGYAGIDKSVAVKFDLYDNAGEGVDSTGVYTSGNHPMNVGSIDLGQTGIDLHNGHVFRTSLDYDGSNLVVHINDTSTGATATQTYPINIPTAVGGNTAYVGFTGGTGGLTAIQDVTAWEFSPGASFSPNAPGGLGAVPATATSIRLSWTANATNQTGYHLDRATDANFTQSLITEVLPGTGATFIDSAAGLAPAGTYYYRLRAFNSAGDSGNSNVAQVTIPVAPPTPTGASVDGVTATTIDLSWQDNAGHQADEYRIMRAADHGAFTQVATLPPTSRTAPSTYEWTDENLTPGTFYEYHILAVNTSGNNDFAGTNVTTLPAPPVVTATANDGIVYVTWIAPAGAVAYNVFRTSSPNGTGATLVASGVTSTTYDDTNVAIGTTYFYTVTAVNGNDLRVPPLPAEGAPSTPAHATPLFFAHINFTTPTGEAAPGYLTDTGVIFGDRGNSLSYGWTRNDTAHSFDRDSAASPDELHDSFHDMRAAVWHIAVPNGTYQVHILEGDPLSPKGLYRLNVGDTRAGGIAAIRSKPSAADPWVENTVTVTITRGVLWVHNVAPDVNRLDAIDIEQVQPGVNQASGFAGAKGIQRTGSAVIRNGALQLTGLAHNRVGTAFITAAQIASDFHTTFDFRLTSAAADGFAFVIQGVGPKAHGLAGAGLGYASIDHSVAIKFDLFDNAGEGTSSTGLYLDGATPTNAGSVDLTASEIDLHAGHRMHADIDYAGGMLTVMLTDTVTGKSATQTYAVDIVAAVGGSQAYVGFTGGTSTKGAVQSILNWNYTPRP
jgi:Legume lectin domain/Bacterial lectin/Fibronectin type III domain